MSDDAEIQKLIAEIRDRFPAAAHETDECLVARGCELEDLPIYSSLWVEAFADRTTDAVKKCDADVVVQHTNLIAKHFLAGGDEVRKLIDVSYAENLMWDASEGEKLWAWPFIAGEIQRLYAAIWGVPGE
ncbi:MAG: hypothetical protein HYZ45_06550 [Burkholderiales bacterium]|nr:hypothetical protein [Burkholderiales bacterium]